MLKSLKVKVVDRYFETSPSIMDYVMYYGTIIVGGAIGAVIVFAIMDLFIILNNNI